MERKNYYWHCQSIGWGIACAYWAYFMYYDEITPLYLKAINLGVTFIGMIAITHCYKLMAIKYKWIDLPLRALIPVVVLAMIVLSILFFISNIYINYYTYENSQINDIYHFVNKNWHILVTGVRMMSIWLLAYHMYHFARRGAEAERDKVQAEKEASEASLANLRSQLNPHFLFNSLNSIKALVNDEPQTAKRAIVVLADTLRNSLNISKKQFITLHEEIAYVEDFLEMEKLRFEEHLKIHWDVASGVGDCFVLPLSLQTLVENALKHGIAKQVRGGQISIKVIEQDELLHIQVSNPGQYKPEKSNGIGLRNLQKRLQLIYGSDASLNLSNTDESTVNAFLKIPARKI